MLALDSLKTAQRIYAVIVETAAVDAELHASGKVADLRSWLHGLARLVEAERPVVAGVIGTLTAVQAAMAEAKAPAGAVIPLAANDHTHGLSAPSETPPNIA